MAELEDRMESSTKLLTLKEHAINQLQSSIDPDSEVRVLILELSFPILICMLHCCILVA